MLRTKYLSAPSVVEYKSKFAVVDSTFMAAFARVCDVMYCRLDQKEAGWLASCMQNKVGFKRQHAHQVFAFLLVDTALGEVSEIVQKAGCLETHFDLGEWVGG